jgi:hypothetical protein
MIHRIPCGAAVCAASVADLRWFEAHPHEAAFLRPLVHGEFGPLETDLPRSTFVLVRQLLPGLCERFTVELHPYYRCGCIPERVAILEHATGLTLLVPLIRVWPPSEVQR